MIQTDDQTISNILRLTVVLQRTGLSRSSLYTYINAGTFPKPISLGARCVGWLETEINNWIQQRITASRGGNTHGQK